MDRLSALFFPMKLDYRARGDAMMEDHGDDEGHGDHDDDGDDDD